MLWFNCLYSCTATDYWRQDSLKSDAALTVKLCDGREPFIILSPLDNSINQEPEVHGKYAHIEQLRSL